MSIKPKCGKCKKELTEVGALLFSYPYKVGSYISSCHKTHLCRKCFVKVRQFIKEEPK